MTDLPPTAPPTEAPPGVYEEFRSLRRSRSDRVVAGVLGGLGRRLGIDPVVLRVATVVLAIFGGVGVLLYTAAWLLVPAEDEDSSILDQALGRGDRRGSSTVPLALTLAVVGLVSAIGIIAGTWDSAVLLLLAGAGVYLVLRRRDDGSATDGSATDGSATDGSTANGSTAAATDSRADDKHAEVGTTSDASPPGQAWFEPQPDEAAEVPATGWPDGPDWGTAREPYLAPPAAPAPPTRTEPERKPKPKSAVGPATFCAALVAVGILAVNDAYWAAVPAAMYVALPLAIVAVGLLVSAWYGRSRGLIVLGILLSLALVPVTWASQWQFDNAGDATYTFTTVDELPTEAVSHGAGTVHYDLSGLALPETGEPIPLTIEMGAGDLTITVPEDADVTVNASVGAGDLTVFGDSRDGLGQSIDTADEGTDGPGGGEIVLDIDLGMGDLEVTR